MLRCTGSIVHLPQFMRLRVSHVAPLSLSPKISVPITAFFLFLSHLHRALRMCLRAMTRAIEYPTFVRSSLFFPRSTLVRIDSPTSRPTLFPPSFTFRSRTNVDAKEVSLNERYLRILWSFPVISIHSVSQCAATKRESSSHYGD